MIFKALTAACLACLTTQALAGDEFTIGIRNSLPGEPAMTLSDVKAYSWYTKEFTNDRAMRWDNNNWQYLETESCSKAFGSCPGEHDPRKADLSGGLAFNLKDSGGAIVARFCLVGRTEMPCEDNGIKNASMNGQQAHGGFWAATGYWAYCDAPKPGVKCEINYFEAYPNDPTILRFILSAE